MVRASAVEHYGPLFLTSKVRLHCDVSVIGVVLVVGVLFLTSKVRLHCDKKIVIIVPFCHYFS